MGASVDLRGKGAFGAQRPALPGVLFALVLSSIRKALRCH